MKCRKCRREIEENSVFCNWCGFKQVAEPRATKVPPPKHNSKRYYNRITVGDERVYVDGETEEEYYAKARAAKNNLIEIKKSRPKLTLGTAIDNFINDNDKVLSPSTVNAYKSYRKTRFQDYIDSDVGNINWQRMINAEAKDMSAKTVHNAWRLVTAALKYADYPIPTVNLPKKQKSDRPWLDYQQIQTFTLALRGKPYELGALLALHGLRRSELLHLTAGDVDLENGVIHVRGASVVGTANKLVDKDTNKNITSTRDVHIVIPRLTELIRGKNGRLITTNPTTLYGSINGLCAKTGLPEVGVHGLRHSYVSLCFHLGVRPDTVMVEGGYSNLNTVNEVYRHLASQDRAKDIEKVTDFFTNKSDNIT